MLIEYVEEFMSYLGAFNFNLYIYLNLNSHLKYPG